MRSMPRPRAITTTLLLVAAVAVAGYTTNAMLRPGCSLLPVALPNDASGVSQPATVEQACAALGRSLPQAMLLPNGVQKSALTIDGAVIPGMPRRVAVGYAKEGHGVALLGIVRQDAIPVGNVAEINSTVAGVPAVVKQVRIQSADADDVSYLWARDGLLFTLHIGLGGGITREAADAMASSIR